MESMFGLVNYVYGSMSLENSNSRNCVAGTFKPGLETQATISRLFGASFSTNCEIKTDSSAMKKMEDKNCIKKS